MDINIFVQNVKKFCKAKGVPPTIACAESGAGKNLLNSVSKGHIPSIESVENLAEYLGCTVNDLLGTPSGKDPLREWWNSLPEETKKAILALAKGPEDLA